MEVNDAMFERLAKLARLKFDGEERKKIKRGLQAMIGMVEKLDKVDTEGVEPLLHISGSVNMMRDDIVASGSSNEDALKNAGQKQKPYFIVPKVIKK